MIKATADLHLHSFYSDGAQSPEEMVARAHAFGYEFCALTDHDGTGGVKRALAEGRRLGIKVLRGIELSSEHVAELPGYPENRYFMHILGYGIDVEDRELNDALEHIIERRFVRNEQIREAFKRKGIEISLEELQSYTPQGFVGKPSFARVLKARGLVSDLAEAFKDPRYLGDPEIRAIRKDKISAELALKLIRGAGGMAFFAHPYQLSYVTHGMQDSEDVYRDKLALVVKDLARLGMRGIEACYPTHNSGQRDFALDLAKANGLLVSRGSDDHGLGVRPVKQMGPFRAEIDPSLLAWVKDII